MSQTFMSFGISKEFLEILNTEQIQQIQEEPEEELLLVNSIKSQTAEKKASRDYFE